MNLTAQANTSDNWRWLHQLEPQSHAFWDLLSQFGKTPFCYKNQAFNFRGRMNLEQAFVNNNGYFLTSQPSINLLTTEIENIYVEEPEGPGTGSLELDFKSRCSSLTLPTCSPQKLRLMTTLFGWELKPETPALRAKRRLTPLKVCPCCSQASAHRRKHISSNPLANIIQSLIEAEQKTTLTLSSQGLGLVTSFQPRDLELRDGILMTRDKHGFLSVDAGYLHAILVQKKTLDNQAVCELSLINSSGCTFASLSAPAASFQKHWVSCLSSPEGSYEAIS